MSQLLERHFQQQVTTNLSEQRYEHQHSHVSDSRDTFQKTIEELDWEIKGNVSDNYDNLLNHHEIRLDLK